MATAAIIAGMAVMVGAEAMSVKSARTGAAMQQDMNDMHLNQVKLAAAQKNLQEIHHTKKLLGAQTAEEATRGISLASPSFKMLQQSSYNTFTQDEKARALNIQYESQITKVENDAAYNRAVAATWGAVAQIGGTTASMFR